MDLDYIISKSDRVLVTGSSGFIGAKVVEILLEYGFESIRCFTRPSSRTDRLKAVVADFDAEDRVEVITGDLLSPADCETAASDVSVIYHLAAGIEKSFAGAFMNSALATRNLVQAFLAKGYNKRFVNTSSFAVYSNLDMKRGALLDENCPIEDDPQKRNDAYGFGKIQQDRIVEVYAKKAGLNYVLMRPGSVFGPGKKGLTGRIGIDTFGFFIHLGGSNQIPLTYVDNCAEAIVLAGLVKGVEGEAFNIVDDDLPSSRAILRAYKKKVGSFFSVPIPYWLMRFISKRWESYSRKSGGQLPPVFNERRCSAEWKGNKYSNQKLKNVLGWKPRIPMNQALAAFGE